MGVVAPPILKDGTLDSSEFNEKTWGGLVEFRCEQATTLNIACDSSSLRGLFFTGLLFGIPHNCAISTIVSTD